MRLIMTQPDVEEALRSHVLSRLALRDGLPLAFEGNADGSYSVLLGAPSTSSPAPAPTPAPIAEAVRERGKPAPGKARRTQAEIAEDEAADAADAPATDFLTEISTASAALEANEPSTEAEEPPFDVVEQEAEASTAQTEEKKGFVRPKFLQTAEPAAPKVTPVEKPKVDAEAPTSKPSGRSLFGGLTRPNNS